MRLCLLILIATTPAVAGFVIGPSRTRQIHARYSLRLAEAAGDAEKELEAMSGTWDELKKREKEVEKSHDEAAAIKLLQNVLETAIDYTRIREHVEEEHASSAHAELEKAIKLEESLKSVINDVHHDADYADIVVGNYKVLGLPEDKEERREMAVAEIAHHIENYAEERLHEAREAELRAKDEEDEAARSLKQLMEKENELRATLEELKVFKQQKEKQE